MVSSSCGARWAIWLRFFIGPPVADVLITSQIISKKITSRNNFRRFFFESFQSMPWQTLPEAELLRKLALFRAGETEDLADAFDGNIFLDSDFANAPGENKT